MTPEMPETQSREHAPQETFLRHLGEGSFKLQQCAPCGQPFYFPRTICPTCASTDLSWVEMSGRGTVYSTTIVRRKAEKGGDYNVCLVDLEEGPRMMSRVENIAPEAVRIGMPVRARIATGESGPMVVFECEQGEQA